MLVIFLSILANFCILFFLSGASTYVSILLGTLSIFMPNGYLLYNFAATFKVNFSFEESAKFFWTHMVLNTAGFVATVLYTMIGALIDLSVLEDAIPENSFLHLENVQVILNSILLTLGALSMLLGWVHWKYSIVPLHNPPTDQDNQEEE